ncbi:MAG TPA: 30S ribosomal protein S3 [Patescibacteria group bacterium]|nr:30S ribosomal protein S3 [Patescibacteria group bacterium]
MGQKVNPRIFRMGGTITWTSKWFHHGKNVGPLLQQDQLIRKVVKQRFKDGGVGSIEVVRRAEKNIEVIVSVARPGVVIGRGGQKAEEVKEEIKNKVLKRKGEVQLTIRELKKPMLSADVVVASMANELERRMPFRRVMKGTIDQVKKAGALGVKVQVAGRLNGAEIARTETLGDGSMPLHTLRADISYGRGVARTTYGAIGVKVWIYKGELFGTASEDDTHEDKRE